MRRTPKLGVCWYTEESWSRIKSEAVDPERFEATYREWMVMAEDALQDLIAAGVHPVKVLDDADALRAWCESRDEPNNAASRAALVAEMLRTHRAALV